MDLHTLRNIGIIAHIDAGKTTFSERVLFYTDVIHRMGEVHEGAATMDFMPEEQERGITIASACITCSWHGHTINLVDTPGHVDFTVEVERCLRVLDAAIGIFCAVGGVEPQSETVWRQADGFGVPRLAVVNKMDRVGASFAGVLTAMEERLKVVPVPLVVPVGEGEDFCALLDIVRQERLDFDEKTQGRAFTRTPFTPEDATLAAPWREKLLDCLTEDDDRLLTLCLAGEPIPVPPLEEAIRAAVLEQRFVPVFAASALRNMGVQPVLDAVCAYLPGPLDLPAIKAQRPGAPAAEGKDAPAEEAVVLVHPDPAAPLCGLVFKVVMDGKRKVAFVRIYSGTLREGDALVNATRGGQERAHRLYRLRAARKEQLAEAQAGDIVAVQGMKLAQTGDTLTDPAHPLLLEPLRTWRPVIALAFEPRNAAEGERLDEALALFCAEDPTLHVELDEGGGQRIVSGMGELHLEIIRERILREFSLAPRVGNPQVVRRETIGAAASGAGTFDRDLGDQPHYGHVELTVAPAVRGAGVSFLFEADAAGWAPALVRAVSRGIHDACSSGVQGYPLEDVAVTVTALGNNGGKATEPGMYMAAQAALRHACSLAMPRLLEPLMLVDVVVPEAFLGPVVSLLGARGAKVEHLLDRGGSMGLKQVRALAPMRELFGFSTALRSATQGRAGVVMTFVRFDSLS